MPTRSPRRTTTPINYRRLTPYTPYVTRWSDEHDPPNRLIERPGGGIAYDDEIILDRDDHGVLWQRTPHRPRQGEPLFAEVHPLRQRRAMRRLLCNVCGTPADQNEQGTLWLARDYHKDVPDWPHGMRIDEAPVCQPCARTATRLCPALRHGAIALRARHTPIVGVRGLLYRNNHGTPVPMAEHTITYHDPRVHWIQATYLVRELHDCTLIPLEDACRNSTAN